MFCLNPLKTNILCGFNQCIFALWCIMAQIYQSLCLQRLSGAVSEAAELKKTPDKTQAPQGEQHEQDEKMSARSNIGLIGLCPLPCALAHSSMAWLHDLITKEQWPPSSPDHNRMDCFICGFHEAHTNRCPHTTKVRLIASIKEYFAPLSRT